MKDKPLLHPSHLRDLCTQVRQLLLALDLRAGDITEAAQRVEAEHGGAMALAYQKARMELERLGEDIDQKERRRQELERELHRAARYLNREE